MHDIYVWNIWVNKFWMISISQKFVCLRVDGINVLQGTKIDVIKQIQGRYVPSSLGVHCVAHHTN